MRRPALAVSAASLALLAGPPLAGPAASLGSAVAAPPERLAEELTDHVGVVTDPVAVEEVQDRLVREKGLQLFVVVVDDFDGMTPQSWLEETSALSQLGDQDMAAAFSSGTGELALWVPEGTGLVRSEVDRVEDRAAAAMADGEVDAAVRAVVEGLDGATQRDSRDTVVRIIFWVVGLGVLLHLVLALVWSARSRARRRAQDAEHLAQAARLAREHGAVAVELDDALAAAALEVDFAAAEFEPPLVASMGETVSSARDQSLEAHRRRGAVVTGPVDAPHWQVPPARAHAELEKVLEISRTALDRVRGIPALLDELRHQSDLVPTRIGGLRQLASGADVAPDLRARVEPLLARAEEDVAAGRPESALIPLQTVVALLEPAVSGSGSAAEPPPGRGAPGR